MKTIHCDRCKEKVTTSKYTAIQFVPTDTNPYQGSMHTSDMSKRHFDLCDTCTTLVRNEINLHALKVKCTA